MAKEVIVQAWCDACDAADDDRTAADAEHRLGFGTQWGTLDLCKEHYAVLVLPLEKLFLDLAAPVDLLKTSNNPRTQSGMRTKDRLGIEPKNGRPMKCLWCPADYAGTGIRAHWENVHGFDDSTFPNVFGTTCPVCNEENIPRLSQHAKKHPPCEEIADLFFQAFRQGDPYAVVAKVLAKAKGRSPLFDL